YYLRVAAPEIETKRLTRRLKETTLRDALTGMYNRRFLDEFTSNLESSVDRSKSSLGVMMCDIDYFKKVNDERGHASGDMVLAEIPGFFHEIVRGNDLVIRYGGEEIVVILMNSDGKHTVEVAERIRKRIESHTMKDGNGSFSITISIGVNLYDGEHGSLSSAIQQADEALYRAKDSGRNRVILFDQV
ncbi:MAG: GGDEF domain-containing protein, partial [Mariprofundaceae bacterium]